MSDGNLSDLHGFRRLGLMPGPRHEARRNLVDCDSASQSDGRAAGVLRVMHYRYWFDSKKRPPACANGRSRMVP